jgi:HD-GYP domain-containing protein (c-di-GMP phosphodiesterase class II)
MKKRIATQDLRPGMYIAGMDQSWFRTPFLRHKWLVKREDEITLLRSYGIQDVFIDTEKGCDIIEASNIDIGESPKAHDVSSEETPSPPSLDLGPNPEDIESARVLRAEAISTLDLFFSHIKAPSPQHLMEVRGAVSTLLDGLLEHQQAMVSLIQMRRFDANLATHGVDTSVLAMAMGQEYGCDPSHLKILGLAAMVHDIGQLRLPFNLLHKTQPYLPQDHKLIQAHCDMGEAILNQFLDFPQESKRMVLQHHERLDGSGYPKGLRGEEISELTQILCIADTYDAQISGRCSHPPVPPARALSELYKAALAGQYAMALVQRLIQLLGVYPIGSLVRLNTGEEAVVVWVHSHSRLTPTIKLLKNASGLPYEEQEIIDLSSQKAGGPARSIHATIDPHQAGWNITKILDSLW